MDSRCRISCCIQSLVGGALLLLTPLCALATWSVEVGSGAPYNFPMPLHIHQNGQYINMTANYETRPFEMPYYYDLRIGKWEGNRAWEFEDIHHKIYLENTTDQVQHFSISHGYNFFFINRALRASNQLIYRFGCGIVIGHPESTINGEVFPEDGGTLNNWGYYLAGPAAQASLGRRFYLSHKFFVELEGKVTAGYAIVPVAGNGQADAPDVAVHANFGLGYDF